MTERVERASTETLCELAGDARAVVFGDGVIDVAGEEVAVATMARELLALRAREERMRAVVEAVREPAPVAFGGASFRKCRVCGEVWRASAEPKHRDECALDALDREDPPACAPDGEPMPTRARRMIDAQRALAALSPDEERELFERGGWRDGVEDPPASTDVRDALPPCTCGETARVELAGVDGRGGWRCSACERWGGDEVLRPDLQTGPDFRRGDRVRFDSGPWCGATATVTAAELDTDGYGFYEVTLDDGEPGSFPHSGSHRPRVRRLDSDPREMRALVDRVIEAGEVLASMAREQAPATNDEVQAWADACSDVLLALAADVEDGR
jgi:hypothetical protein